MTSTLGFMCSLLPELGGASGGRKVPLLDILATSKFLCNKLAVLSSVAEAAAAAAAAAATSTASY
jgi:hypothetical protein